MTYIEADLDLQTSFYDKELQSTDISEAQPRSSLSHIKTIFASLASKINDGIHTVTEPKQALGTLLLTSGLILSGCGAVSTKTETIHTPTVPSPTTQQLKATDQPTKVPTQSIQTPQAQTTTKPECIEGQKKPAGQLDHLGEDMGLDISVPLDIIFIKCDTTPPAILTAAETEAVQFQRPFPEDPTDPVRIAYDAFLTKINANQIPGTDDLGENCIGYVLRQAGILPQDDRNWILPEDEYNTLENFLLNPSVVTRLGQAIEFPPEVLVGRPDILNSAIAGQNLQPGDIAMIFDRNKKPTIIHGAIVKEIGKDGKVIFSSKPGQAAVIEGEFSAHARYYGPESYDPEVRNEPENQARIVVFYRANLNK